MAAFDLCISTNLGRFEFNTLREGQFVGIVYRARHPTHVRFPRIAARFAATSRFLLAAKRAADLSPAGANVDVHNTAIRTGRRGEAFGLAHVCGQYRRREPLWHTIVNANGFVELAVAHQIKNRREGLVLHDWCLRADFNKGGPHVITARGYSLGDSAAAVNLAALLAGRAKRVLHRLECSFIDEWADQHAVLSRITNCKPLINGEYLDAQRVRHRLMRDEPP